MIYATLIGVLLGFILGCAFAYSRGFKDGKAEIYEQVDRRSRIYPSFLNK
jgi:hypothetical protein